MKNKRKFENLLQRIKVAANNDNIYINYVSCYGGYCLVDKDSKFLFNNTQRLKYKEFECFLYGLLGGLTYKQN